MIRGATERLVPILMTALAAGLALVPIALSAGEPGSEIQAPMAMVIMFGLLSSTALNMVVVPILYERFGRPAEARGPVALGAHWNGRDHGPPASEAGGLIAVGGKLLVLTETGDLVLVEASPVACDPAPTRP